MKKAFSIYLSVILAFTFMPLISSAEAGDPYQGTLNSSVNSVMTDETVTVTVGTENASVLYGAQYYLNYDSSKYVFTDTNLTNAEYEESSTGTISVTEKFPTGATAGQRESLATFTFKAKPQSSESVNAYFTLNDMKIAVSAPEGTVVFDDAVSADVTSGTTNASNNVMIKYNTGLAAKLSIPAENTRTFIYDGKQHVIGQVTADDSDVSIAYGTEEGSYPNDAAVAGGAETGTYLQYYKASEAGYYPVEGNYELVINQKPLTLVWNNKGSQAFSGSKVDGPQAVVTGFADGEEVGKYTVTGNTGTSAGKYTAVISFVPGAWQNNYVMPEADLLTEDWEIVRSAVTNPTVVSVNTKRFSADTPAGTYSAVYDGKTYEIAKISTGGVVGDNEYTWYVNNVNVGSDIPKLKDAGRYEISYRIQNDNYPEINGGFTIIIEKYTVILEWAGPDPESAAPYAYRYTYDGKSHCPTAKVSNLCSDERYQKDVCEVTVEGGKTDSNWTPDFTTVDNPYDGDYNSRYTAKAVGLSNPNYKLPDADADKSHEFSIIRKEVTISVDGAEKNFGDDDPVFTGTVDGYLNENDRLNAGIIFRRDKTPGLYGTEENPEAANAGPRDNPSTGWYQGVITADYITNNNYRVCYYETPGDTGTVHDGVKTADFRIEPADSGALVDFVEEYTYGRTLVLVYLNSDRVVPQYNMGTLPENEVKVNMIELKNFGYKSSDDKQYVHVFGLVVGGINSADADRYAQNVSYVFRDENTPSVEYSSDINGSGNVDVSDVAAIHGIYNGSTYSGYSMEMILRANYVIVTPYSANRVNMTDINRVHSEVLAEMNK